jgi:hypothetical protein
MNLFAMRFRDKVFPYTSKMRLGKYVPEVHVTITYAKENQLELI